MNPVIRMLRKRSTWAEKKLWAILRDRRFSAYKFRRQYKVGPHILDFYCGEARYNLELDGSQHGLPSETFLAEFGNIICSYIANS
jgi:very-short-patch-repair endonuclease